MITAEEKARIARENGAKSKGPVTPEGKEKCARNAISHGRRAQALKLIVPPHSACLANEDRQAFYKLFDSLTAKFRPEDATELALVREIADLHWKASRNAQMESAIYNRELVRQGTRIVPSLPELRDLEIAVAAQEALTGNKTIAELRKETQRCHRAIAQLQRNLLHLQRHWPAAATIPPTIEADRQANAINDPEEPEQTGQTDQPQPDEQTETPIPVFNVNGPITQDVADLYASIFHPGAFELDAFEQAPDLKAA